MLVSLRHPGDRTQNMPPAGPRAEEKNSTGGRSWRVCCFEVGFEGVQSAVPSDRKGKVIPRKWAEDKKGAESNSGKSGGRNLEA